jgi:hypothetical protein
LVAKNFPQTGQDGLGQYQITDFLDIHQGTQMFDFWTQKDQVLFSGTTQPIKQTFSTRIQPNHHFSAQKNVTKITINLSKL